MAVTDPLAFVADYEAAFGSGVDNVEELGRQLSAVSRWIEWRCGQQFARDAAAVARVFVGDGTPRLWLETNLGATPTAVAIDVNNDGSYAGAVAAGSLEPWPLNAAIGPEARPWRALDLRPWATDYTSWPAGLRVRVTAVWGWPAVPEAVRQACVQLTAILRIESPRATSTVDELGRAIGMSSAASRIVDSLLEAYPRVPVVG